VCGKDGGGNSFKEELLIFFHKKIFKNRIIKYVVFVYVGNSKLLVLDLNFSHKNDHKLRLLLGTFLMKKR